MFKIDLKSANEEEGYYGTIFRDKERDLKLFTRLRRNGDLDGFGFTWKIGKDHEREWEWRRGVTASFMDVKYVFDRERCITNPLSDLPPYDWLIESLEEESELEAELAKQMITILAEEKQAGTDR